jgi:hypothetical protein
MLEKLRRITKCQTPITCTVLVGTNETLTRVSEKERAGHHQFRSPLRSVLKRTLNNDRN